MTDGAIIAATRGRSFRDNAVELSSGSFVIECVKCTSSWTRRFQNAIVNLCDLGYNSRTWRIFVSRYRSDRQLPNCMRLGKLGRFQNFGLLSEIIAVFRDSIIPPPPPPPSSPALEIEFPANFIPGNR